MSKIKDALAKARRMRGEVISLVLTEDSPLGKTTKIIPYSQDAINKHKIISLTNDPHGINERFKLFKTQILAKTQISGDRTVLVTSCTNREGKTFTAINLAIMFAREVDQRVLLVDANLNHPSVLQAFGVSAKEGLTDYLLHNKLLNDLLICPGIEKLTLLPAGKFVEQSNEMFGSLKMQDLIAEMKGRYNDRYIFIDGPSLLTSVDTLVLSKYIDKVLLVVESGKVSPQQLSEAINLAGEDKILGTVLNKRKPA